MPNQIKWTKEDVIARFMEAINELGEGVVTPQKMSAFDRLAEVFSKAKARQ